MWAFLVGGDPFRHKAYTGTTGTLGSVCVFDKIVGGLKMHVLIFRTAYNSMVQKGVRFEKHPCGAFLAAVQYSFPHARVPDTYGSLCQEHWIGINWEVSRVICRHQMYMVLSQNWGIPI